MFYFTAKFYTIIIHNFFSAFIWQFGIDFQKISDLLSGYLNDIMIITDPVLLRSKASGRKKEFEWVANKLLRMKYGEADRLVHELHHNEFAEADCLKCANCCRTLGPRLTHADIKRISDYLKTGTSEIFDEYVSVDEDKDYVFNMPCPFLGNDNHCVIYRARPRACRNYPHTDQKSISKILIICIKNTAVCPVVYNIFEKLSRDLR